MDDPSQPWPHLRLQPPGATGGSDPALLRIADAAERIATELERARHERHERDTVEAQGITGLLDQIFGRSNDTRARTPTHD